jgi:hypothetical protein
MTPERLTWKFCMHAPTLEYDLGPATLTSFTGYLQFDIVRQNDVSLLLIRYFTDDDSLTPTQAIAAVDRSLRLFINDSNDNYTLSQELRRVSDRRNDPCLHRLADAYYEDGEESVTAGNFFFSSDGAVFGTANVNGQPADFLLKEDGVTGLRQYAAFTELPYEVIDSPVATIGYRHSNFKSSLQLDARIGDEPDNDGNAPRGLISGDPFTEKFDTLTLSVSHEINESMLAYARSAEGFRLGFGSEVPAPLNPGCDTFLTDFLADNVRGGFLVNARVPGATSDTLWVAEANVEGSFNEGRGTFATSVFYGDWADSRVKVESDDITGACNTGFTANAAFATSGRIEAGFPYRVTDQPRLSGTGSWRDATVDDDDEPFLGESADERCPGSPDPQLSITAGYAWDLLNGMGAFVRADAQYIGEIHSSFKFGDPRTACRKYALANLCGGVLTVPYGFTLFMDNATDNRADVFSNGIGHEFVEPSCCARER